MNGKFIRNHLHSRLPMVEIVIAKPVFHWLKQSSQHRLQHKDCFVVPSRNDDFSIKSINGCLIRIYSIIILKQVQHND